MPNYNDPAIANELVQTTIRSTIRGLVPQELIKESELDAITAVCMMAVNPTGKEKPRKLMSEISDSLLETIVTQLPKIENSAFGKMGGLFIVEWCYRQGHLECDWYWKWVAPRKGKLFYQSKLPIDQIPLPSDNKE